jgi:hypothetical protein
MTQQQQQGWDPPPAVPPAPGFGDFVGDLIWIRLRAFQKDAATPWGIKDEIVVDYEIIAGRNVGERAEAAKLSNVLLARQFREWPSGKYTFGRVGAQQTGQGNPAVVLNPPAPGDEQYINAWLQRRQGAQQQPAQQQPAQQPAQQQPYQQQPAQPPYQPAQQQPPASDPWASSAAAQQPNGQQQQQSVGMPPAAPPPREIPGFDSPPPF